MGDVEGQIRERELDPQAEARRRAALARIRQFPDPVLRLRAREVEDFDDDLASLAERMKRLMQEANGVGLAGNQVGALRRLFVFQADEDERPRTIVNPQLVERSEEVAEAEEGCLSLGPARVPVERHVEVTLEGRDVRGEDLRLRLAELDARVVQHELDHLDGVLIIDRTTPEARRAAMAILRPKPVLIQ